MEIIDTVSAYLLEDGDNILFNDTQYVDIVITGEDFDTIFVKAYSLEEGDVEHLEIPYDALIETWGY